MTVEVVDVLVAWYVTHNIVFADFDGLFHHPAGKLRLVHAFADTHDNEPVVHQHDDEHYQDDGAENGG
jgi:hypothetical protein